MGKLKLNLDQLTVDSFGTEAADEKKGTVFGEQCTCQTACTCPGCNTCDASCNGTCWTQCASCNGTCDTCHTCNDPSWTAGGPNCLCCY
jgi:hypothetical protein